MTREEMDAVVRHNQELVKIRRNVSALYLLSDLNEVWAYLWAKVDDDCLTEEEADKIFDEVNVKWANTTLAEINKICAPF